MSKQEAREQQINEWPDHLRFCGRLVSADGTTSPRRKALDEARTSASAVDVSGV